MQLEGILTRAHSVPQTRRKLPAPFARPRIDLDGGKRVKRSWKDTPVTALKAGDTVANFGTVANIVEFVTVEHDELQPPTPQVPTWRIRLYNVMDEYQDYPGHQRVFAFSAEDAG